MDRLRRLLSRYAVGLNYRLGNPRRFNHFRRASLSRNQQYQQGQSSQILLCAPILSRVLRARVLYPRVVCSTRIRISATGLLSPTSSAAGPGLYGQWRPCRRPLWTPALRGLVKSYLDCRGESEFWRIAQCLRPFFTVLTQSAVNVLTGEGPQ